MDYLIGLIIGAFAGYFARILVAHNKAAVAAASSVAAEVKKDVAS